MKKIKSIVTLLLVIVVLIFAIQNTAAVQIHFLFWSFSMPRAMLIASLIGIGMMIGILAFSLTSMKKRGRSN